MNNTAKKTKPIDLIGNKVFYFKMGDDKYCQKNLVYLQKWVLVENIL